MIKRTQHTIIGRTQYYSHVGRDHREVLRVQASPGNKIATKSVLRVRVTIAGFLPRAVNRVSDEMWLYEGGLTSVDRITKALLVLEIIICSLRSRKA